MYKFWWLLKPLWLYNMAPDAVHSPGQLSQTENCKRGEKLQTETEH